MIYFGFGKNDETPEPALNIAASRQINFGRTKDRTIVIFYLTEE
jgi:hypothetical protein